MDIVLQLGGVALVLLALADLYQTVLFPKGPGGPVSRAINFSVWAMMKTVLRGPSSIASKIIPHTGPLVVVIHFAAWAALLLFGWTFIVWPEMGDSIQASGGKPTPVTFTAAFYYASYSLTTLGTGDLVPQNSLFRVLMVTKAAMGFSFITLSLTYVMSVYSALNRRNVFAVTLHGRTQGTGDPARYLALLLTDPHPASSRQSLDGLDQYLADYFESHQFYPILHFFRFNEVHYSMARMLYIVLDIATLARTALDEDEQKAMKAAPSVHGLWNTGLYLLDELTLHFLPRSYRPGSNKPDDGERQIWRRHYENALEQLAIAGVSATSNEAGVEEYMTLRKEWNARVKAFATYMGQDWKAVTNSE